MTEPTRATIDTRALAHNLERARAIAGNAAIMAVIKADAYGHGMVTAARALQHADAFAVAHVDEALALREAGLKHSVVVLEGVTDVAELGRAAEADLEIIVHCSEQLELLEHFRGSHRFGVWLKLDTGMNRLGFRESQAEAAIMRLHVCDSVADPLRFMTHLANADNRSDDKTREQLRTLARCLAGQRGAIRSIANSAGLFAWPDSRADWVRPGIMLYGASPFPNTPAAELALAPVMTFESLLISVKTVLRGETVGYGGTWRASRSTRVGIAGVGYGDGYPRHVPNGTPVLVNGKRVPLVGRVSMDMLAVDLSEQPEARVGDRVTLWGGELSVDEIAGCAETIPYELLCSVTRRVPRVVVGSAMDAVVSREP